MNVATVYPSSALQGTLLLPGDKSISHRAVIFSALSEGNVLLHHLLESEDVLCTIRCFQEMGVSIEKEGQVWKVRGVGLHGLKPPGKVLYCGNSGTTLRLMLGVLAAQPFETGLSGDASLSRRPVKRVTDPLTQMGAAFRIENDGTPDRVVWVKGGQLQGIRYESPVASAQLKSALLLAGLWAQGKTTVAEPFLSRDHTERMMSSFGVNLDRSEFEVTLTPPHKLLLPSQITIPGDFSSAAFFLVAGLLVPDSKIVLKNVGLNPTRIGALEVLEQMGGQVSTVEFIQEGGEEKGSLEVLSSSLSGISMGGEMIPRLIDEIPILAVAAACARGETVIQDASELRVKESDRIQVLVHLLQSIGVSCQEKTDGLSISGGSKIGPAKVKSFEDHRMAMSMSIAALVANGPIVIEGIDCVKTSFPEFWDCLKQLGVRVELSE